MRKVIVSAVLAVPFFLVSCSSEDKLPCERLPLVEQLAQPWLELPDLDEDLKGEIRAALEVARAVCAAPGDLDTQERAILAVNAIIAKIVAQRSPEP